MKASLIDDASVHFAASKNREYRDRVRQRFSTVIGFLQSNGLTTRVLLAEGELPTEATKIMRSDLTDDGFAVLDAAYDKWLRGVDRGKPIADVSLFEHALRHARGGK